MHETHDENATRGLLSKTEEEKKSHEKNRRRRAHIPRARDKAYNAHATRRIKGLSVDSVSTNHGGGNKPTSRDKALER